MKPQDPDRNGGLRRGSAGAALEALDLHDDHGAGLEAQPAAGGEVGQCLVDGLAGGADQLGELLLGEVVVDVDAVVGGAAEAVAEGGPGSKSESSPNIWPGPRIARRFSRPSEEVRPSFTLPSSTM